jgi:hypothetical protein
MMRMDDVNTIGRSEIKSRLDGAWRRTYLPPMELDLEGEHASRAYAILSALVTPRPIEPYQYQRSHRQQYERKQHERQRPHECK